MAPNPFGDYLKASGGNGGERGSSTGQPEGPGGRGWKSQGGSGAVLTRQTRAMMATATTLAWVEEPEVVSAVAGTAYSGGDGGAISSS